MPDSLAEQLAGLQEAARELEEDVATPWTFAGCPLFIKPHGAGKSVRWIVHHPDTIHLEFGKGKLNGTVCRVTFRSVYLHAQDLGKSYIQVYRLLVDLLGYEPVLQVSEVHQCVDIAGWDLTGADADCFVSRGSIDELPEEEVSRFPEVKRRGRRVKGFYFSKTAPHSCAIYNKSAEVVVHHKEWFHEIWRKNGWDGESTVTRIEFRYERECLREMGIECPYAMLDELDNMWAYSARKWLRHTVPTVDTNQSRWPTSAVWDVVQTACILTAEAVPSARVKKVEIDIERSLASFTGFATSMAARLVLLHDLQEQAATIGLPLLDIADGLPRHVIDEDGGGFLSWVFDPMQDYLTQRKQDSFFNIMSLKVAKLGQPVLAAA